MLGDSLLVINWARGIWRGKFASYSKRLLSIQSAVEAMASSVNPRPRTDSAELFRHVYRELNGETDRLAGKVDT